MGSYTRLIEQRRKLNQNKAPITRQPCSLLFHAWNTLKNHPHILKNDSVPLLGYNQPWLKGIHLQFKVVQPLEITPTMEGKHFGYWFEMLIRTVLKNLEPTTCILGGNCALLLIQPDDYPIILPKMTFYSHLPPPLEQNIDQYKEQFVAAVDTVLEKMEKTAGYAEHWKWSLTKTIKWQPEICQETNILTWLENLASTKHESHWVCWASWPSIDKNFFFTLPFNRQYAKTIFDDYVLFVMLKHTDEKPNLLNRSVRRALHSAFFNLVEIINQRQLLCTVSNK